MLIGSRRQRSFLGVKAAFLARCSLIRSQSGRDGVNAVLACIMVIAGFALAPGALAQTQSAAPRPGCGITVAAPITQRHRRLRKSVPISARLSNSRFMPISPSIMCFQRGRVDKAFP